MDLCNIKIEKWEPFFNTQKEKKYFSILENFLETEISVYGESLRVFPPREKIFNCLHLCNLDNLKVVILGQDPYHQEGQAMGLSFSVPDNIKLPPSLINIFKEIKEDCGIIKESGDLTSWAEQGILLLNTALTVRESCPNSHQKYWKPLTDNLIKYISDNKEQVIFLLWGTSAKNKKVLIDNDKHYILEANHPSPLSANRGGWFGNKHFSKTNQLLRENNLEEIKW